MIVTQEEKRKFDSQTDPVRVASDRWGPWGIAYGIPYMAVALAPACIRTATAVAISERCVCIEIRTVNVREEWKRRKGQQPILSSGSCHRVSKKIVRFVCLFFSRWVAWPGCHTAAGIRVSLRMSSSLSLYCAHAAQDAQRVQGGIRAESLSMRARNP